MDRIIIVMQGDCILTISKKLESSVSGSVNINNIDQLHTLISNIDSEITLYKENMIDGLSNIKIAVSKMNHSYLSFEILKQIIKNNNTNLSDDDIEILLHNINFIYKTVKVRDNRSFRVRFIFFFKDFSEPFVVYFQEFVRFYTTANFRHCHPRNLSVIIINNLNKFFVSVK